MSAAQSIRYPLRMLGLVAVAVAVAAGLAMAPSGAVHAAPTVSQLTTEIKQQSQQFNKVVEQYDKITGDMQKTRAKIRTLDKRITSLSAQVSAQQRQVGELAAQAYEGGGTISAWNALLGAKAETDLTEGIATVNRISTNETRQVHRLADAKKSLSGEHQQVTALYRKQVQQKKSLDSKKQNIEAKIGKLKKLRTQAYGRAQEAASTSSSSSSASPTVNVSGNAGVAVKFAYAQLGKPYEWAADGPDSYDCSGLTMAAWAQAGVSLPHNAAEQYDAIPHISRSDIQPGDLVFYEDLGHVAIYVGNGQIIQAPTFGEVVKVSSIDMEPVYGIGRP